MSATNVVVGDTVKLDVLVPDGGTGLFPQAVLRDASNTPLGVSPLNLTSVAGDLYSATFTMPATSKVTVVTTIYTDAGHTVVSTIYNAAFDEFVAQDNVPSSADIADAVWDEAKSGHVAAGSFGLELNANQSEHDATQAAIAAIPSAPTVGAIADAVWDEPKSGHATAGTFGLELSTSQAEHDATQAAIAALNNLSQAGVQAAMTAQGYTAVRAAFLDFLDAAISSRESESSASSRAATDQAEHDATQAAIAALPAAPSAASIADAVWDENILTHQTLLSTGRYLTNAGLIIIDTTATGTPTVSSIQLASGSTIDDYYKDQTLIISSGAGIGQVRIITGYVGATKTCSFDEAFKTAPSSGDQIVVQAVHQHPVGQIADAVWDEPKSGHATAGTFGLELSTTQSEHDTTQSAIAGLNNLSQAGVQAAMTAQGYTTVRAALIDFLDALISSRESETNASTRASTSQAEHDATQALISALNNLSAAQAADAVWDEAISGHLTAGSTGEKLNSGGGAPTVGQIADAVWDEAISGHLTAGTTGKALSDASAGSSPSAIADAVWDEAKAGHVLAGSFGLELNTNQAEHDATQSAINSLSIGLSPSGFDLEGEIEDSDIGLYGEIENDLELEGVIDEC